ncbi:MAG TPA: hypothetical protein VF384_13035 [Planctomycetota bacterium]
MKTLAGMDEPPATAAEPNAGAPNTAPEGRAANGRGLLGTLDDLLRNASRAGTTEGTVAATSRQLVLLGLLLAGIYGCSLGAFGLFHDGDEPWLQLLSAVVKLPLVFALTVLVTWPSLYVFATLIRSPLGGTGTLRLLLQAIVVQLAILGSLGPVFAFFAASTASYPFLLLLNVLFCAIGGIVSLVVLQRAARALLRTGETPRQPPSQRLLTVWCLLYGTVGAQMAWLLRPFLLAPGHEFSWLRARDSNVFAALLGVLRDLFAGR